MKKILLFFTFLLIFYTSFSLLFYKKEHTKLAFLEEKICTYIINFETKPITTKKISAFNQKDFEIISITPYFSPVYEKKIDMKPFRFTFYHNNISLKKFEKQYFQELSKLGLKKEIAKYTIQGVPIQILEVRTNLSNIQKLKEKYPLITYFEL